MQWTEQVKLQDGKLLLVARTAAFSGNSIAGGGGGSFNQGMTLRIISPTRLGDADTWDAKYVPILLDEDPDTHEWFIVATFYHCNSWYELGRPKLPYAEYRFHSGQWIRQPLSGSLVGRSANLLAVDLSDRSMLDSHRPFLPTDTKDAIIHNSRMMPEYKRIVDKWPTTC